MTTSASNLMLAERSTKNGSDSEALVVKVGVIFFRDQTFRTAMTHNQTTLLARFFLCFLLVKCVTASAETQSDEKIAIKKGLKYLQESGEKWKNQRGCVSCHQIPPMVWAMSLAKSEGYDQFESSGLSVSQWIDWSTKVVNFVKPEQKETCNETETMTANLDTMAGLLLAIPSGDSDGWRDRFARHLITKQSADGTWNPCGQLPAQRRPVDETRLATTLWVSVSLEREQKEYDRSPINKLIESQDSPQTLEVLSLKLLLSESFPSVNHEATLQQILDSQNNDGGWGWKVGEPSDALGTGTAVYAISATSDSSANGKAIQDAKAWLISTQQDDGKWLVPGTKRSANGRTTQTANDWGTAWAMIALLQKMDGGDPRQVE
jgi:squalene-hopene/tetraprenyl-beta-curcumene cyclase